jgi:hypothetical protein
VLDLPCSSFLGTLSTLLVLLSGRGAEGLSAYESCKDACDGCKHRKQDLKKGLIHLREEATPMAATSASEAPHRAHLQASTTVSHILSAVSGVIGRKSLAISLHASSEGRLLSASAARSCLFV